MAEELPPISESQSPESSEEFDWTELMADYDWKINFTSDPNDPDYKSGLDIVRVLREQYGYENVLVNLAAYDSDKDKLARIPGKLGVHVRKDATRRD